MNYCLIFVAHEYGQGLKHGMKVVIINKSDSTGGAAVVSRRLMEALRLKGVDASMLVVEKFSPSPWVSLAAGRLAIKRRFFLERLKIFIANGFNRSTLFQIDTGEVGLPLWRHPEVKAADAILLSWVNQGMLSLRGIGKLKRLGKPIIWTMHDMWPMTGICHHAATCRRFLDQCGDCPLLGRRGGPGDLSHKIWERKQGLYKRGRMAFVAVSRWLRDRARLSGLLKESRIEVIPNPFMPLPEPSVPGSHSSGKIRILFGAARLDDPVKGLDILKKALALLTHRLDGENKQEGNSNSIFPPIEVALFGNVKEAGSLAGFQHLMVVFGTLKGDEAVARAYREADILVSASSYETFGCTLQEAQAYGVVPVSFNQGGQVDIIEDGVTGFLAEWVEDEDQRARNLAEAMLKAIKLVADTESLKKMKEEMARSVAEKFSYSVVADAYIDLIESVSNAPS
ncbi:MAG: glycosyltransferase [Muribaculaceae bacterium]|nr:glycosyltransferase [Muribaculaceae bacterium]